MKPDMQERLALIRSDMNRLLEYANALNIVGNRELGTKLADIFTDVFEHCDEIEAEFSSVQTQRVKDAEQASLNILAAALAGIEVAKHEDR